ncbi:MAG: hypothetical protein KGI38_10440, partial [Thaumarchaeota archaeon]|nr:hypothetical protein [Nitrososphaerota archaeon]
NDTGGIGANITALYIQYTGERVTTCMGVGLPNGCSTPSSSTFPSCQFPAYVNVGTGTKGIPTKLVAGGCTTSPGTSSGCTSSGGSLSSCLDTGEPANATVAVIRIITQRGNLFSATYPPSATTLAAQALSSGAIGDLYLSFRSYTYYTLTTTSCPVAGTPEGSGTSSGFCLLSGGPAGSGFAISSALTGTCSATNLNFCFAWSVRVTDLNPQHANIVLDPYTLFSQIPEKGSGTLKYTDWYVISNSTNVILSLYTPIVLLYNKPVSIVFASGVALTSPSSFISSSIQGMGSLSSGTITPVFIVSHGCEAIGQTTCLVANSNYGQNSPYVATLFY